MRQQITPCKLYEKIREMEHANGLVLIYVPAPWMGLNLQGRPAGYVRASTSDVMTLMRAGGPAFTVDIDETHASLLVTIGPLSDAENVNRNLERQVGLPSGSLSG